MSTAGGPPGVGSVLEGDRRGKTRRWMVATALSVVVVVLVILAVTLARMPPSPRSTLHVPEIADGWAGYVSTGSNASYLAVEGSWTVPSIVGTCPSDEDEQSFTWIGIGGWNDDSSIGQIGTEVNCEFGVPYYLAWYEFYPLPSVGIPTIQLAPGDSVFATATYSGGSFELAINDTTTNVSFNATSAAPAANRTSAEWIEEAPLEQPYSAGIRLPLTDFGRVTFLNPVVNRGAGFIEALSAGGLLETYYPSSDTSGGAVPGALSSDSFDVAWSGAL